MKKLLALCFIVVLVIAAYLGQVAYMGKLNSKVYELITQDNEFYSIENREFQKGFFTSTATLYLKINLEQFGFGNYAALLDDFRIRVNVVLKNNIFAKDNIEANFENPVYEFVKQLENNDASSKINLDKNFASVKVNTSLSGKIQIKTRFNDFDIKNQLNSFTLKNFLIQIESDKEGIIYGSQIILDELTANITNLHGIENNISVKNLSIVESLDKAVDYVEYFSSNYFVTGKKTGSIQQMQIFDFHFSDIQTRGQSSIGENGLGKANAQINIKNIVSPLMQINLDTLSANLEMSNISMDILNKMNEILLYQDFNEEEIPLIFFSTNPILELKSLNFNSNEHKITSKGLMQGSQKEYTITLLIESEAIPSGVIPPLQFLDIDQFFVQKEGKYILDFKAYSDYESIKITLNGEEISEHNKENNDNVIIDVD